MEEIFEIRSYLDILTNDIKIYTIDLYIISSTGNKELQVTYIHTGDLIL